jgi:hypothetical protein
MAGPLKIDSRNWDHCFLCQSNSTEEVVSPSKNTRLNQNPQELHNTVANLIKNIKILKEENQLPSHFKLQDIDIQHGDVHDLSRTLIVKDIKWHKSYAIELLLVCRMVPSETALMRQTT